MSFSLQSVKYNFVYEKTDTTSSITKEKMKKRNVSNFFEWKNANKNIVGGKA